MKAIQKAITDFLHHCRHEKKLSDKTLKAYGIDLKQFVAYLKDNHHIIKLKEIDKKVVSGYLNELYSEAKPKTIKRKVATLRAFFNFIEFEDRIVVSPFRKMKVDIKQDKALPHVLTIDEIEELFKYLYEQRDFLKRTSLFACKILIRDIAIFEMLFSTGMRVSEISDLRHEDVDLDHKVISVNGRGHRERNIPIVSQQALSALQNYRSTFHHDLKDKEYFFINKHNRKISDQSIRILVEKYAAKVGIKRKITPHTFRHTVATLLMESGVDLRYVQYIMGHSSITTTQVYNHPNEDNQRKLLAELHPRTKVKIG
ncbi:Tyrosine-type recombinase/integrase [Sulfidibacter corallicola]|uniref:Tyrosine-type recombinase/integrase n=1 Tax=Sulfidibacter corallicola TaxID=2818388 RepID=A0A8A4TSG2_SULCO|nr:tyrosine-type recombinase/integrase [Sulfidibacter corallicola]QTD51992.1 tyrosine-type recombinase/integrase [Sulfidibacter corallicola]